MEESCNFYGNFYMVAIVSDMRKIIEKLSEIPEETAAKSELWKLFSNLMSKNFEELQIEENYNCDASYAEHWLRSQADTKLGQ